VHQNAQRVEAVLRAGGASGEIVELDDSARTAAEARPEVDRPGRRNRPTSVWTLLVGVAPELAEWAEFFAAGADKRVAAQSGMRGAVTAREADDLVRDAGAFLDLVAARLGLPSTRQSMLPLRVPVYPAEAHR
jgi:hypothetical protein